MRTKTIQGKLWSAAPHYWSKHFEPYFLPIYKTVLQQLQLTDDTILLDAGCGSGLFTQMAVKTGAQVTGVDAAPGLLEVARQRSSQANFLEEDLEAMPFADQSFDVITGFNSFQYAGNFDNALKEAVRILKTGGRLVIAIWNKPELSDATQVLKAICSLLPPPPPGTPSPFILSEDGRIESICEGLGLRLIYKTNVACPFLYHSSSDGLKSFMGTAPAAAVNQTNNKTVEETISNALKQFHITDDICFLQNSFLLFILRK